jgi:hypothetical protein
MKTLVYAIRLTVYAVRKSVGCMNGALKRRRDCCRKRRLAARWRSARVMTKGCVTKRLKMTSDQGHTPVSGVGELKAVSAEGESNFLRRKGDM